MSKEDLELFKKEIETNTTLKKEVELAKELNHFLSDDFIETKSKNKKLAKEIKTYLQSDDAKKTEKTLLKVKNEYHTAKAKPKKKNFYFAATSISVLFISVFSYFMLNQNTSEELFAQYYSVNDLPSVTKRGNDLDNLNKGVTAFKALNYKEAIQFFNNYTKQENKINASVYLYNGIANM